MVSRITKPTISTEVTRYRSSARSTYQVGQIVYVDSNESRDYYTVVKMHYLESPKPIPEFKPMESYEEALKLQTELLQHTYGCTDLKEYYGIKTDR